LIASVGPFSVVVSFPPPVPINGSRCGSGAAESVCEALLEVKAASAWERVLGVRPEGVKAPDERKEPSVGGMRDGRELMMKMMYYCDMLAWVCRLH
jgi:hypothetical protein